ncbi:unnamed protein product [Lactuca saligna]|uniref:Uncharacterized protein n=1 Tax=Lactuca saligna TaxID=75948 RepID=A0AA35V5Y8_LACSI|nr:unnamed protein product [Lactuca saligna]
MLKSQENRLKLAMEKIEKQHGDRLKDHACNFENEVTKLHDIAKERHEIFLEQVKKLEDSVNLQVVELKSEMSKEVDKIEKNYSLLHGMDDVNVDAIKKLVEYKNLYSTKLDAKSEQDSKVFEKLEEFLGSLKESRSKVGLSQ